MKRKRFRDGALGRGIVFALALVFSTIFWSGGALALPTFQTYIAGATAGSSGQDLDTWFITANSFNLYVVSSYVVSDLGTPNYESITNATLLISVPQGETGTISVGGLTPLTSAPETNISADLSILSNVSGNNGYSTLSFLPVNPSPDGPLPLPLHYPLQDNVSDFLIYDLGPFAKDLGLNDYDASTGTITPDPGALGEQKPFAVSFTGFSSLHFDLYGLYFSANQEKAFWEINPDSHDATALASAAAVPEPGTLVLLVTGLASLGLFGRRRSKDLKA
jgi:hypothetical protein